MDGLIVGCILTIDITTVYISCTVGFEDLVDLYGKQLKESLMTFSNFAI